VFIKGCIANCTDGTTFSIGPTTVTFYCLFLFYSYILKILYFKQVKYSCCTGNLCNHSITIFGTDSLIKYILYSFFLNLIICFL
jgi:hypothetical protein